MKVGIFTVYDRVAQTHMQPYFSANEATATRQFVNSVTDPNHGFNKSPQDYDLIHIGYFDDESGEVSSDEINRAMMNGNQCFPSEEQKE